MPSMTFQAWIIVALAGVVLWLWFRVWRMSSQGRRRAVARAARATAGEREAERVLEEAGFAILDRQVRCLWWIEVDGEEEEVELRADLLVERDGERFVAEVKTGVNATDPNFPPTRRQLLEYRLAFDPHRVLLVDVEDEEIMEVAFPRVAVR
jgi:hypothetical protein